MKRSEINAIMRDALKLFDEYKIKDKYSFGKYSFTNCIVFY